MRVYFDSQIFSLQRYGGISNYFLNLIFQFLCNPALNIQPVIEFSDKTNIHLKNFLSLYGKDFESNNLVFVKKDDFSFISSRTIPDIDLIHFTYYLPSKLLNSKYVKKVSTIHDFIPESHYSFYSPYRYSHFLKSKYIGKSDGLIFVSSHTKSLAELRFKKLSSKHSAVIHHGVNNPNFSSLTPRFLDKNYFLYVGKRDSYKNFLFLLRAFSKFVKTSDVYLVCFGGPTQSNAESRMIKKHKLENRIIFVSDKFANINDLYRNAIAFINPSRDEGFGITNLEALSNKCPVLCSDIPVFREVLSNCGIYFDPFSENSLLEKMRKLELNNLKIDDEATYQANRPDYSWFTAAKKTADFYKSLV